MAHSLTVSHWYRSHPTEQTFREHLGCTGRICTNSLQVLGLVLFGFFAPSTPRRGLFGALGEKELEGCQAVPVLTTRVPGDGG